MSALISQQGVQPEVPGYKPPEAFEIPKTPDFTQESREGAVLRTSPGEQPKQENLDSAVIREKILQQAERLKSAGDAVPSEIDVRTKAMLEKVMRGETSLDELDVTDPDAITRSLMQ